MHLQEMSNTTNVFCADIVTVPHFYDNLYFILQLTFSHTVHDFRTLAANFQRANLQELVEVEAEASKSGY